ncbi:MAG: globin [Bacteroidetes bacterium CG18_big_fil_WC_8_21_14_2_50_41_14]|nr:MAG: globin [Bacteroidetes bacterium CG18_big_fil_WC_8_21_14_2_50_41_14]PIY34152.1 MAG: globin [Bacteroidetes bacterium CG_4_10_14_3_um_filter_42_6]PJB56692.1 MAG: globin [Bacteroidetes bacterium CG_4_9_14_3_um_filter_41_19]
MQLSLYQTIGPQHIKQLIHDFYQGVQTDQLLIPMYRDGFAVAEDRLHLFMIQYLGGPTTYSDQRGHPQLRKRHAHFTMNAETRTHWLQHMNHALDLSGMLDDHKQILREYFTKTAEFLTR